MCVLQTLTAETLTATGKERESVWGVGRREGMEEVARSKIDQLKREVSETREKKKKKKQEISIEQNEMRENGAVTRGKISKAKKSDEKYQHTKDVGTFVKKKRTKSSTRCLNR